MQGELDFPYKSREIQWKLRQNAALRVRLSAAVCQAPEDRPSGSLSTHAGQSEARKLAIFGVFGSRINGEIYYGHGTDGI